MVIGRRRASWVALAFILIVGCTPGSSAPTAAAPSAATASGIASPAGGGTAAPASLPAGGGAGGPVAAGGDPCGLLGPADFAAAGVAGTGIPKENNADANNAYCVYAGTSAGTGGVEFDAFLANTRADSEASFASVSAPMLDFGGVGKAAFPDADGAVLRTDIPGGYAGIAIWKGRLVFDIGIPTTDKSAAQLISLAKLVLQRASGLV